MFRASDIQCFCHCNKLTCYLKMCPQNSFQSSSSQPVPSCMSAREREQVRYKDSGSVTYT